MPVLNQEQLQVAELAVRLLSAKLVYGSLRGGSALTSRDVAGAVETAVQLCDEIQSIL